MDYKEVRSCRVCGSKNLSKYLDLGKLPLANKLLESPTDEYETYPLQVLYCKDCSLSQLSIVVDPNILYNYYPYFSSVSETFRKHCGELADTLKDMFVPQSAESWQRPEFPTVLDIASNDNCLLREFQRRGFGVLGVDPASNFNQTAMLYQAIESGNISHEDVIPTISRFWSHETAMEMHGESLRPRRGFDFITAQNVFAHVDDVHDFLRGVNEHLSDNGVFVVEVPHILDLIKNNEFDTIYHEHLSYFTLRSLVKLFEQEGLPIFRAEKYPIHGGTLRIYASRFRAVEDSVESMLVEEEKSYLYDIDTYEQFARYIGDVKIHLNELLRSARYQERKVVAYGASAKGSTLLNYCGIKYPDINCIIDDTPAKQGKFMAGTKLPIVNANFLNQEKPHYVLLTAWNFAHEIMQKTKGPGYKYIVPIPRVEIV